MLDMGNLVGQSRGVGLLGERPSVQGVSLRRAIGFSILIVPAVFTSAGFHAASTPEYSSTMREFRSRFLSLDGGSRLELMVSPQEAPRLAHIAISVGSRPAVDRLVKEMEQAGVQIVSGPRVTGDGYYEAVIADSEGNRVEITA